MPENKEVRKLELCDIAPYAPFDLQIKILNYERDSVGIEESVMTGYYFLDGNVHITYRGGATGKSVDEFKPYLRSLDQLTQEITHNGQKLVFTELFETGDDGGYNYEFDFGNIKLIKHLETIAKNNIVYDIAYLPHQVIKEMLKYHFDISGLCDSGLAIPIHNTK